MQAEVKLVAMGYHGDTSPKRLSESGVCVTSTLTSMLEKIHNTIYFRKVCLTIVHILNM